MTTGRLVLQKTIPKSRSMEYKNSGWIVLPRYPAVANDPLATVSKEMETQSGTTDHCDCDYHRPCYIQTGKIKRPMGKYAGATVSGAISMDYMGSAKFEFGAPALSMRRVQAQLGMYRVIKCDGITAEDTEGKTYVLRMFANFDTAEHQAQYVQEINNIIAGRGDTKEVTYLEARYRRLDGRGFPERGQDFWWDIRNDVFMTFDKMFMNRLDGHIKATLTVLDTPKEETTRKRN